MFRKIWSLGHFHVLHDGDTFCAIRGDNLATGEILDVGPTKADALRAVAYHASLATAQAAFNALAMPSDVFTQTVEDLCKAEDPFYEPEVVA